jgi:hypothetical protein
MISFQEFISELISRSEEVLNRIGKEKFSEILKQFFDSEFSLKDYPVEEALYIDFVIWFGLYYKDPKTNKTVLDEILPKFDKNTIENIKNMKIISGNFTIRDIVKVNNQYFAKVFNKDKGEFLVKVFNLDLMKNFKDSCVIECHLANYGGTYYFLGSVICIPIITREGLLTPAFIDKAFERVDDMMLKDLEATEVKERSTLKYCLSKYPASWINEICDALNIKANVKKEKINKIIEMYLNNTEEILAKLPPEAIEILKFIMTKGGFVKYGELTKKYSDDTTYFQHTPETPLGLLRFYGFVFVGKMNINGRNYKVAIIPSDLRARLKQIL